MSSYDERQGSSEKTRAAIRALADAMAEENPELGRPVLFVITSIAFLPDDGGFEVGNVRFASISPSDAPGELVLRAAKVSIRACFECAKVALEALDEEAAEECLCKKCVSCRAETAN